MSSFTGVVGAVIAPSKVISGLEFAHHLHLTNKGDPGILEIIIVTSDYLGPLGAIVQKLSM